MKLKILFFTFLSLTCLSKATRAQTVKVQFINNSADAAMATVDIYINGILTVDDLNFRNATTFTDHLLEPGNTLTIGIAPSNSTAITDTFLSLKKTLSVGDPKIVVINGIKSTTGYTPYKKVELSVFETARMTGASFNYNDYAFSNGSTDMTPFVVKKSLDPLTAAVPFGSFSSYSSDVASDFKIRLTNTSGSKTLNTYNTQFMANGFNNLGLLILSSGFVNPAANSNGPAMGLWVASALGGPLVELPTDTREAISRVQFINNSADTATDTVDLYVDNVLLVDNFAFRTSTAFADYYSKVPISIAVAPQNSTSAADAFFTLPVSLDSIKSYVFIGTGIKTTAGTIYMPKPGYELKSNKTVVEDATIETFTEVMLAQNSTDAAVFDINEGATSWFTGATYNSFSAYKAATTANRILRLTMGSTIIDYDADFSTFGYQGKAITLLASGFVDPSKNNKGPAFGLYAASPEGGMLKKLNVNTTGIKNTSGISKQYSLWPNPATETLHLLAPANASVNDADVIDITGKVILKNTAIINNSLDISGLNNGVYILHFTQEGQPVNLRFVKQ